MKITLWDWYPGSIAKSKTIFNHGDVLHGTLDDAVKISRELYQGGVNVMLKHTSDPETIIIGVDTGNFHQR